MSNQLHTWANTYPPVAIVGLGNREKFLGLFTKKCGEGI